MTMKSKELYSILLATLLIASIYGCGGSGGSSDSPGPQPTPEPTPSPTSNPEACNSPSLDTVYANSDEDEFYVYTAPGSTLDTHLYSDGSNVFVLVFDGGTTFGFSGFPSGAGTACEFIKASVDFDNDGAFDETAKSFSSHCLRLDNGAAFTFLDGPSRVDASPQFEERLLLLYNQVIYFNVHDALSCDLTEPVPESGIYEPLLLQLQAEISSL
jgi:hypothetical protein